MPHIGLNQMELQGLRHLIGMVGLSAKKLGTYAQQCNDPDLKGLLQSESQKCQDKFQRLMTFVS